MSLRVGDFVRFRGGSSRVYQVMEIREDFFYVWDRVGMNQHGTQVALNSKLFPPKRVKDADQVVVLGLDEVLGLLEAFPMLERIVNPLQVLAECGDE